jgi:hypothetical protein
VGDDGDGGPEGMEGMVEGMPREGMAEGMAREGMATAGGNLDKEGSDDGRKVGRKRS